MGVVGATNLNLVLQEALNPTGEGASPQRLHNTSGDKVMQIRNNYDKEVFNGDIGNVTAIDLIEKILILGNRIGYNKNEKRM